MAYQFTLCPSCNKEIMLHDGEGWDFDYEEPRKKKHTCNETVEYPSKGMNLMGNA